MSTTNYNEFEFDSQRGLFFVKSLKFADYINHVSLILVKKFEINGLLKPFFGLNLAVAKNLVNLAVSGLENFVSSKFSAG